MKELSIAEKANRYDKAIETAKAIIRDYESRNLTDILFYAKEDLSVIFPELKESEDERIRKAIIEFFELQDDNTTYSFIPKKDILGWLEKLGDKFIPEDVSEAALQYVDNCSVDGEVEHDNITEPYWNNHSMMNAYKAGWLKKQDNVNSLIKWHDVSEEPEEMKELLCECSVSYGSTWHEVVMYQSSDKTFWNGNQQIEEVTKWCYIDDIEKQGEQKENLCGKCRKEQPSHSCQDITELGRYALEKQGGQKPVISDDALREGITHFGITQYQIDNWLKKYVNVGKQGGQKEYTFKSIPRLLDMIEPTSSAKVYCQKLIDALVKEGYTVDAKIVGDCLKQMNGEAVPMATMDEQQKQTDTPKFNVGDWLQYRNAIPFFVEQVTEQGYVNGDSCLSFNWENEIHLWTIQDAKDGDALVASDNSIFIFAGVVDGACKYYAVLTSDHTFQINKDVEGGYWETAIAVHPATKEQCDILMKAMDDAGYTFNFELKKIVQKPMPEPIFRIGDTLRRKGKDYTFIVDRIQGGYYHCDHNNGAFFPIEEQDEWELVDKVEPKFKVGDWCIDEEDGTIFQIIKVLNHTYTYRTNEGDEYSCTHYSLENDARHWTIKDAKDGDILHSVGLHSDCVFIFNGLDNWKFDEPDGERAVATGYCSLFILSDKMEFGVQGPDCVEVDTIKPATKAGSELLFSEMEKAGYEWDANKKVLKKIEQKHVCTPKFKVEKGEWYVCTQTFVLRGENVVIKGQVYKSNQNGAIEGENKRLFIDTHDGKASEYFRPWCIQDAKDGDVLVTDFEEDNMIVMYHSRCTKDTINVHCCLDNKLICSNLGLFDVEDVKPATKTQRDLLFQKLKEAGYKWDTVKKELKKIEQKPAWPEKEELAEAKKDAYNRALDKIEYHSEEPSFSDGWDAAIQYLKKVILLEK